MRTPPMLSLDLLADTLHASFGIRAAELTFVPVGDSSDVYVIRGRSGDRWVTKLYDAVEWSGPELGRLRAAACLLDQMGGRMGPVRVPSQRSGRHGEALWRMAGWWLSVQEWLPGRPFVPPAKTARLAADGRLVRLGAGLAALHAYPIDAVAPPDRRIAIVPGEALATALADDGALLPAVERLRRRLLALAGELHWREFPAVLVHGDVVGPNILFGPQAEVALVDWDGLHAAPAEWDLAPLAMYGGAVLTSVLAGYRHSGGALVRAELIEFQLGRYVLFGLEFHLRRSITGPRDERQRDHDRREARRYRDRCLEMPALVRQLRAAVERQGCPLETM